MRLSTPLVAILLALVVSPPAAADEDPAGVWPLDPRPRVIARFDPPAGPYAAGHRGVDLLGTVGQPVRAALPGTVSFTGSIAGVGVVVIDHGPTRTTYQPVAASVAVGTPVAAGATVGLLQPGGSHCPPRACLHWGWIEAQTYLDPLRLVGAGPVRLLPLWSSLPIGGAARGPSRLPPIESAYMYADSILGRPIAAWPYRA